MSTPITFAVPGASAAPTAPGAAATGDTGALFGDVLSGLTDDGPSEGDTTEESLDAMLAAAAAPLGGALLVGLNLPIGDARTLPGSTGATGGGTAAVAPTPTGGTAVPTLATVNLMPIRPGATAATPPGTFAVTEQPPATAAPAPPGQPAPALPTALLPSIMDTQARPTAVPVALTGTAPAASGTPGTPAAQVPAAAAPAAAPPATPVPQAAAQTAAQTAAQAAAGAAGAAALTGTLAGSVAGATVAGKAPAPGSPEPVARTAATPHAHASTVDTEIPADTGSPVGTAVRSGSAFADTGSGQDRGDGVLPRGPEAGWAPTLAAARADSAAATTPAAPAPAAPPQLPPAAQLALRLAPLRAGPDGTHQLTILLHPEELGPVSVVATVKGDQLSVQFTGATEVGRDAMRAALPQLERDLRDGGFATLTLNVRDAPQPDPVRPTWAAPAAVPAAVPAAGSPAGPPATPPAAPPTQPVPQATPVPPTATDYATDGTATATVGAKTDGQPVGQNGQPDGSGSIRRDDTTGQYSPAVTATAQSSGSQFGNTGGQAGGNAGQQSSQLTLGQGSGGSAGQQHHPGLADQQQQHSGGRQSGPAPDAPPPAGHHGPGEPDPRAADHRTAPGRTENRSVDLRV